MSTGNPEKMIRWTARIWGVASLLFLSAIVLGHLGMSGNSPSTTVWIGLAFFPTGIVVGLVIAMWKELLGGCITVISLIGFYAWNFVVSGKLPDGPWFAIFAAPGFLFLLAGVLARQGHAAAEADSGSLHDRRLPA